MNSFFARSRLVGCVLAFLPTALLAQTQLYQLTLKNGMKFEGKYSHTGEISKDLTVRNPTSGGVSIKTNVIVDDGLRRTFFPYRNLAAAPIPADPRTVVKIKQRTSTAREHIVNLGAVFGGTPFDKFGRRTVTIMDGEHARRFLKRSSRFLRSTRVCKAQRMTGTCESLRVRFRAIS